MPTALSTTSYSATVELKIQCAAGLLDLSHTAPDWVIVANPVDLPPGDAEVIVTIDGNERRSKVRLPRGISRSESRTAIERIEV